MACWRCCLGKTVRAANYWQLDYAARPHIAFKAPSAPQDALKFLIGVIYQEKFEALRIDPKLS